MATTQKNYRLGGRLPRYTTTLSTFKNGMFLTEQTVPEGYARVMVNYDIDDTGNHIRPRPGYAILKSYDLLNNTHAENLHFMDYLYIYDENNIDVVTLKDVVLSFGSANNYSMYNEKLKYYESSYHRTVDNNIYELINDNWEVVVPGEIKEYDNLESWGVVFTGNSNDDFKLIDMSEFGRSLARTITPAYSFGMRFLNQYQNYATWDGEYYGADIALPIYTVMNNELYMISAPKAYYYDYPFNGERDYNTESPMTLSKLKIRYNSNTDSYKASSDPVILKDVSVLEAATTGFNMLSNNPYVFNDRADAGTVDILGMLLYPYENLGIDFADPANEDVIMYPKFTATVGEHTAIRVYYEYPQADDPITYKVEYLDLTNPSDVNESKWNTLLDFADTSLAAGHSLWVDYVPLTPSTVVRVTTRLNGDSTTDDVQTLNVYCGATKYDRFETQNFNLNECKGLITWLGRIGVYGVHGAEDTLFFSDIEDAGYFPYPNNILTFETDILAVHNYLDNLLVFTVDAVWIVTPGTNIMTSTQKKILENTNITELDAQHVQVLKQEIFFKMNDQFYVLKPNKYTTDITDLKNYLNSTALSNFTQNFKESMLTILNKMYPRYMNTTEYGTQLWFPEQNVPLDHKPLKYKNLKKRRHIQDIYLLNMYSQIINSEVHYIYKMSCEFNPSIFEDSKYDVAFERFYLHIIYNTLTRSWRLYIEGAEAAAGNGAPPALLYQNKITNAIYKFVPVIHVQDPNYPEEVGVIKLAILKQNANSVDDSLLYTLDEQGYFKQFTTLSDILNIQNKSEAPVIYHPVCSEWYPNNTYLDTGIIAIDTAFTKRYREVQFNLLNMEKASIPFKTYFQLDGKEWLDATQYNVYHVTDPELEDYGTVYITPLELNNLMLYGDTTLQINDKYIDESESWTIDNSKFPNKTAVNVRVELLGRGRRASLQLLNTSLKRYELAELVWVYRMMSAR